MTQMHIHHVELSHTSPNLSGGETVLIEFVKFVARRTHYAQTIYTSESGEELYKKLLGPSSDKVKFVTVGSKSLEKKSEILAYYARSAQLLKIVKKLSLHQTHIILSHEEFMPTTLYSYIQNKLNPKSKWVVFFHMKSPSIMKGFEGEYTGKRSFPDIRMVRFALEHALLLALSRSNASLVLAINPIYKDYVTNRYRKLSNKHPDRVVVINRFDKSRLQPIDYRSQSPAQPRPEKEYDICFIGRFHAQKGIFELIDIVERLRSLKPDVSLVLIGGGSEHISKQFFELIKKKGLEKNVNYKGYISSEARFNIVKKARVLVFPSYFESFGIVAVEAMANGLPVVAYDLPPFIVFEKGMVKVPVLDNEAFAMAVIRLLNDNGHYTRLSTDALAYAKTFSWEFSSNAILEAIRQLP